MQENSLSSYQSSRERKIPQKESQEGVRKGGKREIEAGHASTNKDNLILLINGPLFQK
jgi:hypothetical protein